MEPKVIQSSALYPHNGVAHAKRRETDYQIPWGDPWPALDVGDEITVHDRQGWAWTAVVESVDQDSPDDAKATLRIVGDKTPQPFPAIENGKVMLPNMSGHAHLRSWRKGDIVKVEGALYKVKGAKPTSQSASTIEYTLEPATEKQYETRPGRKAMDSEEEAHKAVGSAIELDDGGWLHVKKVTRRTFYGALGRGATYWANGNRVSAEKAAKLNDTNPVHVARALAGYHGPRVDSQMPADATVLVQERPHSRVPSGERVALVDGVVLHERVGDPDRLDSWHHYVTRIDDKDLAARVKRFIKKALKSR